MTMNLKMQDAPIRILLADDDSDDRLFFAKALKGIAMNTQLTTVADGEQLMQYLHEQSANLPDILFLDLSMPRKTGFECLIEINENAQLKEIPLVVFTTSFGRDINFEQGLINTLTHFGARQYVRKPADIALLQTIIHKALIAMTVKKAGNNLEPADTI